MGTDKKLLSYEICAKLPFGLIAHVKTPNEEFDGMILSVKNEYLLINKNGAEFTYHINDIKPYFRSLTSMSLNEIIEFKELSDHISEENGIGNMYNFLNSHYIQTRDFIKDDLALEAAFNLYYIENR